jgi:hypothetical protein
LDRCDGSGDGQSNRRDIAKLGSWPRESTVDGEHDSHAPVCRARLGVRRDDWVMLLGFFCTGLAAAFCVGIPPGQMTVGSGNVPQCPQALGIYRAGHVVAAYVDDSLGGSEAAVERCAAQFTTVFAGEFGYDQGLPNGLVEWYPVADHTSQIGSPPRPGQAGYILQAFSWGDNVWDGRGPPFHRCSPDDTTASCAARYEAPSVQQLHTMWCQALARHPHVIFWYYAASETYAVVHVEREACQQGAQARAGSRKTLKRLRRRLHPRGVA